MNETIQVLMNRKSVRVFEDKEISPEIKDIILAAAMRAPTGGNCMPYSIIDVTDQSIKDKLAETCDHQPFIAQAKMVLIFCADYAHTACIAAESLGIGSCYIGDIVENFEIHKELLNLPPQVAPLCMLVFGYPTQQQKERKQTTRFAKSSIVFENRYRELSEEELLEMMPNDRTKAFYNRKYVSEFAQEMVRSTKEIYKNWNSKE